MNRRRSFLTGLLGFAGLSSVATADAREDKSEEPSEVFFSYRNLVINFNLSNGIGSDLGTVDGVLKGTILQNFQFLFTSPTTVQTPSDRGLFTDLDGDQILFKYFGTGQFFAPLSDPSSPFGNLMNVGGTFKITYAVVSASGKYKFLTGKSFPGKIVATNAVSSSPGVLGAVYAEIYADDVKSIQRALGRS